MQQLAAPSMKKAAHNCWTCKERKVGCDRALPACANCTRSNRHCQGYGVKLAWPDKVDGRRKQKKYYADPGPSSNYVTHGGEFSFLNTTSDDVKGQKLNVQDMVRLERGLKGLRIARPVSSISGVIDQDAFLLQYYDSVLARMITTIDDDTNGFRLDLIPMALSSSDAAATSLLQATLALSSFHLNRPEEALRHKVKAIKSLQESFQSEASSILSQFAVCMMLCVYSVFDASDTTWHLHLQGARTIAGALTNQDQKLPSFDFFASWFAYHDTFSNYSHSNTSLPNQTLDIQFPSGEGYSKQIIGSLGCSTELLGLISCVNQLRAYRDFYPWDPPSPSQEVLELAIRIKNKLSNLEQEIHIKMGERAGTIDHQRITLTAEFYRIGAALYLYQIAPREIIAPRAIEDLVGKGFAVLEGMEVCTSPWPLFIISYHTTGDIDRIRILDILSLMSEKRRIGNYDIIKGLILAVWKQQDLAADEKTFVRVDWRQLIDPASSVPSFI
ncbi:hypothetical protein EJ04DRAFT_25944 [Polyplosphaeria fusca]|uniref:Zn(2)-C6 fungal-type domain-containing protein n=1 Tax=Polyplosphaeria fusca TaxID=682080 RepID=A0A9P4R8Q3_9PLEO|nr:hypothetical protein EJ04DRAFT_25944 [Polyplosphaeria fusca]